MVVSRAPSCSRCFYLTQVCVFHSDDICNSRIFPLPSSRGHTLLSSSASSDPNFLSTPHFWVYYKITDFQQNIAKSCQFLQVLNPCSSLLLNSTLSKAFGFLFDRFASSDLSGVQYEDILGSDCLEKYMTLIWYITNINITQDLF